jgi:outer membrane receptor protein involved in Fe transport
VTFIAPVQLNTDILDQAGGAGSGIEIDRKIFALTVDYDVEGFGFLDGATLSSLTGYVDDEIDQGLDTTYGGYEFFSQVPLPPFLIPALYGTFNQIDDDSQEDLSQEFRITSSRDEAFRWSLGLYYYRGEEKENRDERAYADPTTGAVIRANQNNASLTRNRVEDKAIFGSLEYDVLENLTGTVELRYSSDEVKTRAKFQDTGLIDFRGQDSEQNWLPRFTVTWGVTDDINLYGNVSKGIKPQAINSAIPLTPAGDPDTSKRFVDQEEAWNYEIGLKSLWWDGRALFNVSGYFFDIDDQQLTQNLVDPNTGIANSFLDTVGETEIWGAEVEGSILLFDYLTLGFNYAYADSEIKEYINQDQADLLGSNGQPDQNRLLGDVSGNQSPRVPEHMASFTSRYERPFGRDGSWFASINYAWEDSRYAQVHNLIETGQRSDLRASIGGSWGPWSLSIWGKNLTEDESAIDIIRYIDGSRGSLPDCPSFGNPDAICTASSPSNSPRGFGVTLPRERQFGATMTFRFGGE